MRIIQILTNLTRGDAIANDVLAIDGALREAGYETTVMALTVHEELKDKTVPFSLDAITPSDLVIFHKSTGDAITKKIAGLSCRKGMVYHNVTPAKFFLPYDPFMAWVLRTGRKQVQVYASAFDFAWGVSEYNRRELVKAQSRSTDVLPIMLPQKAVAPDQETLRQLKASPGTRLLFIGRISPQKKHEDIIKVYWHVLQKDPEARLFLVGYWNGLEKYYAKLKGFCADLKLSDSQVVFTGSISEEEKEAYLRGADALICMSEHEGFCIPLMEAMQHDLPVAAYAAAAVPETLGEDFELLFREKDFEAVADAVLRLKTDEVYLQRIIREQRKQLQRFDNAKTKEKLLRLVREQLDRTGAGT